MPGVFLQPQYTCPVLKKYVFFIERLTRLFCEINFLRRDCTVSDRLGFDHKWLESLEPYMDNYLHLFISILSARAKK